MRITLSAILLYFSATMLTYAQSMNDVSLLVSSGVSIPSDPANFAEVRKPGFIVGGGISYPLFSQFLLSVEINYNSFPLNGAKLLSKEGYPDTDPTIHAEEGLQSIVTFSSDMKYLIVPGKTAVAPYVVGGIGVMNLSASDANIIQVKTSSFSLATIKYNDAFAFYSSLGAGIEVSGGEPGLFIEARYCAGFVKSSTTYFIPVRIGFRSSL